MRVASCHPEEKHKALGLCLKCYKASLARKYYATAEGKTAQKARTRRYTATEKGKKKRKEYTTKEYYKRARRAADKSEKTKEYKRKRQKLPHVKQLKALYRKNNKQVVNANTAERRARKRLANLQGKFKNKTKEVYKNCPNSMEVDHILPLNQESGICGLHVPWNLQYINKSQNSYKCDKFDGTLDNLTWKSEYDKLHGHSPDPVPGRYEAL